jgi:NAD(P)-dependent dehydrogenase (short-subunit alcohol dehydrogenase family)
MAQVQTAVVTGAGQGLGRAVAQTLAARGARVVLVGRIRAKLEETAAVIAATGPSPTIAAIDVADADQVAQLGADLGREFEALDALINCAGEAFLAPLENTTRADWDRLIANNLTGPFLMTREALPLLRRSHNASIINIVSKVALKGYGTVTAYSAAKAGLLGFTHSLADELRAAEIRVVALCPGPVDTPMRWAATPDFDRRVVIDSATVAATVWHIVQLPRGVTMGDILIESVHYD